MRYRTGAVAMVAAFAIVVGGCGGDADPDQAKRDVESSRASVQEATRALAELATGAGLPLSRAKGGWTVCSADPPRLKYDAGGTVTPAGQSVAAAIATLTSALENDGWTVESSGTEPEAHATFARDDLRASLGESRRTQGAVAIGVTGQCVHTTQEQDSLLSEEDQVIG